MSRIQSISSLSLFVSLVLWITAFFTPGWLEASYKLSQTPSTICNLKISLFESWYCESNDNGRTCYLYFQEDMDKIFNLDCLPTLIERLCESIIAVVLTGLCCLLVLLLYPCSHKKKTIELFIVFFFDLAVIVQVILIGRMAYFHAKTTQNIDKTSKLLKGYHGVTQFADFDINYQTPYSIIIAGLGCLFGMVGCVLRMRMNWSFLT